MKKVFNSVEEYRITRVIYEYEDYLELDAHLGVMGNDGWNTESILCNKEKGYAVKFIKKELKK